MSLFDDTMSSIRRGGCLGRLRKLILGAILCVFAMGVVHFSHIFKPKSSIQTAFPRHILTGHTNTLSDESQSAQPASRDVQRYIPVQVVVPSKPKGIDEYWKQTDLSLHYVDELLQEKYCRESEKRFLACVSALIQMAKELRLQLLPNNKTVTLTDPMYLDKSEKEILKSWRHFYRNRKSQIPGGTVFSIQKTYSHLKKMMKKQDAPRLTAVALNAFISVDVDPHSYLMPTKYYKEIISKADPMSSNLGIALREQNRSYYIRRVFEGSLAEKNGLKRNDELVEINGVVVKGLSRTNIQDLLRAEIGDTTNIRVRRDKQIIAYAVQRQATALKTVSHALHAKNRHLGIITLNKFASGSCELVERSIRALTKSGATSLLLDLRDNTGGQIDEASCMIGLFVGPKKNIFQLKYFEAAKGYDSYSTSRKRIFDGQLAVLINSNSASASEIVAGVLKELNRALIVGDRSFGKGSFQEGEPWGQGDDIIFFKTQGLFYFPSGQSPQGVGVVPDVYVATEVAESHSKIDSLREDDLYWSSIDNPDVKLAASNLNRLGKAKHLAKASKDRYNQCLNHHQRAKAKNQLVVHQMDVEMEAAQEVLGCLPQQKWTAMTGNVGAGLGR